MKRRGWPLPTHLNLQGRAAEVPVLRARLHGSSSAAAEMPGGLCLPISLGVQECLQSKRRGAVYLLDSTYRQALIQA